MKTNPKNDITECGYLLDRLVNGCKLKARIIYQDKKHSNKWAILIDPGSFNIILVCVGGVLLFYDSRQHVPFIKERLVTASTEVIVSNLYEFGVFSQ